jgi:PAS domain S-box-containing protein
MGGSAKDDAGVADERFRRFVDANIIGIVVADAKGAVIEANDYYLGLIGATRDEARRGEIDWRAVTPPEWLEADDRAIRELEETGTCTPYEKEYVRRDGSRVWVLLTDAMLPGPERHIAAFVLDLTERTRAEALARSEAAKLDLALRAAGMGAWELDLATGLGHFDARACGLLGIDPAGFEGRQDELYGAVHPDDRDRLRAAIEGTIREGVAYEPERGGTA